MKAKPFAARWYMRRSYGMGPKAWEVVCVSLHRCRADAEAMLAERKHMRGRYSNLEMDMQECLPTDIDYPKDGAA